MPRYLDTTSNQHVAIAICGRCKEKVAYDDLVPDPNYPGVLVSRNHPGCLDVLDPWRLPPRETEDITLEHARPDQKMRPDVTQVFANPLQATIDSDGGDPLTTGPGGGLIAAAGAVTTLRVETVWQPNTAYALGAQVTIGNPRVTSRNLGGLLNDGAAVRTWRLLVCIIPGVSGDTPPLVPDRSGVTVEDNQIAWITDGQLLP